MEALPARILLSGRWASQQVIVTARFKDGAVTDVTSRARFKSDNPRVVIVDKAGVVRPASDGATTITVEVPGAPKGKIKVPVTVKDSRTAEATFGGHIRPILSSLGCNTANCHGAKQGKGGLRLALFNGSPESDFDALTREAGGRRIDRVEPARSLLLLKASGAAPHPAPAKLMKNSPEYEMLLAWLNRGAPPDDPKQPQLAGLRLMPLERTMRKGETQQVLVTALFSDGSERDVTRQTSFSTSDSRIAAVTGAGQIKAEAFGEAFVAAKYLQQAAVVRITIPQPLKQPFPKLRANNRIDELVFAKLKMLGIPPSGVCSDEEFLRRVYLDVIGLLPTPDEARAFLSDTNPRKRAELIDHLLEREEFADFWSIKWGDLLRIKSEYPVRVWPKAVAVYYRWLRESIAQNKPYDQMVRELLLSSGSNFRVAPVNFFRANASKDPQSIGETTALVFMGARIGCARCHAHPLESWTPDDNMALGAFFSKLAFKSTLEWKEEIVYSDPRRSLRHRLTRDVVQPRLPGGELVKVDREEDPRQRFAAWLTSPQNPWFTKNIANRVWYWLMGRGIVHEPDDMRSTNPPENPELLDHLAKELVAKRFDLKHLYRLILNSRTYQASSQPLPDNAHDFAHFSHYPVKRLTAEQLLDAISAVTETSEKFTSRIPEPFSYWPEGYRATQISDGNTECQFLDLFGRPPRDTPYEAERSAEISLRQALYFVNSEQLEGKITNSPRLKRLLAPDKSDDVIVEELYLTTLSRLPREQERRPALDYLAKYKNQKRQAVNDLIWAILNSKEFIFNH